MWIGCVNCKRNRPVSRSRDILQPSLLYFPFPARAQWQQLKEHWNLNFFVKSLTLNWKLLSQSATSHNHLSRSRLLGINNFWIRTLLRIDFRMTTMSKDEKWRVVFLEETRKKWSVINHCDERECGIECLSKRLQEFEEYEKRQQKEASRRQQRQQKEANRRQRQFHLELFESAINRFRRLFSRSS